MLLLHFNTRVPSYCLFVERGSPFRPCHVSPHGCDYLRHQRQHGFHRSSSQLEQKYKYFSEKQRQT